MGENFDQWIRTLEERFRMSIEGASEGLLRRLEEEHRRLEEWERIKAADAATIAKAEDPTHGG